MSLRLSLSLFFFSESFDAGAGLERLSVFLSGLLPVLLVVVALLVLLVTAFFFFLLPSSLEDDEESSSLELDDDEDDDDDDESEDDDDEEEELDDDDESSSSELSLDELSSSLLRSFLILATGSFFEALEELGAGFRAGAEPGLLLRRSTSPPPDGGLPLRRILSSSIWNRTGKEAVKFSSFPVSPSLKVSGL